MYKKSLAIPAAVVAILSGTVGMGHFGGAAHARVSADTYSGTISITNYQPPNALGAGGGGSAQANINLISAMSDSATGIDNKGNFYADLATDVPSTANGGLKVVNGNEVITYHLKPNQKWSDGSPVTNADWIASVLLAFMPDIGSAPGTDDEQLASVTINGNDLVQTINGVLGSALQQLLPGPVPWEYYQKKYNASVSGISLTSFNYASEVDPKTGLLKTSLYTAASNMPKLAQAYLADNYNSPSDVFNGPYKLGTWAAPQRIVLVPNTFYNALPADTNHPRPAKIQFVLLSADGATYVQDLKAAATYNEIDTATDFTPDNITDLRQTKYQVVTEPGLTYEHLDFMVMPTYQGKPNPVSQQNVRLALNYAVDKFRYLKALFPAFDPKTLALASILPASSSWSINSQLPQNEYNPAKAMQLLKAAGYGTSLSDPKHLSLDFATTTKASRIKSAQILQRFWNQVGVQIRIRYVTSTGQNGLFSAWADGGVLDHHAFQISEFAYSTNPDPDESALTYLPQQINSPTCPNCANYDAINDPTLTKLFLQGRTTLDQASRMKIYAQVQKYFYQQMYNINLYTLPEIDLVKGTIGNYKQNAAQSGNQWNAFQWWFDPTNSQKAITS